MRTPRSLLALLSLALCLFGSPGCGGGAAPDDGQILPAGFLPPGIRAQDLVAASYRDAGTGTPYLVLGDALGRGQAVVTELVISPVGRIEEMHWSPDHSLLAVRIRSDDRTEEVLDVVEPLTGTVRRVSGPPPPDTFVAPGFAWSPDSRHLAFIRSTTSQEQVLFTVDADGSNLLEVSGPIVPDGRVFSFTWSPDSTRLALRMDADTDDVFDVYVVERDGSGRVQVSGPDLAPGAGSFPPLEWSPDGTRVAFTHFNPQPLANELYVSLATGVGGRTRVHPVLATGGNLLSFAWAPDGSRIAYVADQTTDNVIELFTSLPDGTGNVRASGGLVAGGNVKADFAWAPDASRIAYVADAVTNEVFELFTAVPDGSAAVVKVSGPMVAGGDVGPASFFEGAPAWSPDAARLAYFADQEVDGQQEVYVTLPTAAVPVRVSSSVVAGGAVEDDLEWSPDAVHLVFSARHRSSTVEVFSSPPTGPAVVVLASAAGGLARADAGYFSFAGDRIVLQFTPGAPASPELRSYGTEGAAEAVVLVAPTPSTLERVAVR